MGILRYASWATYMETRIYISASAHLARRKTFYDWYPPSLLWLILWLIWRLGLSAYWSHRGTRARGFWGYHLRFGPWYWFLGFYPHHVP